MHRTDELLQRLWSKAVGTDGYSKDEWKELQSLLESHIYGGKSQNPQPIELISFKERQPEYSQFICFVCPVQHDRWEVGWCDTYHIRVEGGESYRLPAHELGHWFLLPAIPGSQSNANNQAP